VDYLRSLRRVQRVSLVAWSLGGPRSAGYAAQNPDKIEKLVLLAPAYRRDEPAAQPALPARPLGGGATGSSAYALGPNALRALHARQTDANGSFIAPHFEHRRGCGVSEGCTPTSYQHYTGTNA